MYNLFIKINNNNINKKFNNFKIQRIKANTIHLSNNKKLDFKFLIDFLAITNKMEIANKNNKYYNQCIKSI